MLLLGSEGHADDHVHAGGGRPYHRARHLGYDVSWGVDGGLIESKSGEVVPGDGLDDDGPVAEGPVLQLLH